VEAIASNRKDLHAGPHGRPNHEQALMTRTPVRALLVGPAHQARWVRRLFSAQGPKEIRLAHAINFETAAEHLARGGVDVMLLDLGPEERQVRTLIRAAHDAAPGVPLIVLDETQNEALAVDALQRGAQDFLDKASLSRAMLARALRFAIERHRLQTALRSLSLLDELTGLHNRRGFLALAEQHLLLLRRRGAALLVFVDLDGLKGINDMHGHLEGNRALMEAANVLRSCFREADILARIGGDEFCVLMTDTREDSSDHVRQRLQKRVDQTNALEDRQFRLSLSVGIAEVQTVHQPSVEEMLSLADALMYEQKRDKKTRAGVRVFDKQHSQA